MNLIFSLLSRSPSRAGTVIALAVVLGIGSPRLAADTPQPQPQPRTTEAEPDESGKQCEWACQRWTKLCNVDPRGVYKCRRSCAKFGEVCE